MGPQKWGPRGCLAAWHSHQIRRFSGLKESLLGHHDDANAWYTPFMASSST